MGSVRGVRARSARISIIPLTSNGTSLSEILENKFTLSLLAFSLSIYPLEHRYGSTSGIDGVGDEGVFWIDYESLQHRFSFMFMNWKPRLFPILQKLHGCWKADASGPRDDSYVVFERKAREPHFHRSLTDSTHSCHLNNS